MTDQGIALQSQVPALDVYEIDHIVQPKNGFSVGQATLSRSESVGVDRIDNLRCLAIQ